MITNSIRWEVFTLDEKRNLKTAIGKSDYKVFTNLVNEMTPEKEAELQKLVALYRSQAEGYESEVRREMETEFLNKNDITPEQEAEWQKKLDKEKAAMEEKAVKISQVKKDVVKKITTEKTDGEKEVEAKLEKEKKEADEKLEKEKEEAEAKLAKEESEAKLVEEEVKDVQVNTKKPSNNKK